MKLPVRLAFIAAIALSLITPVFAQNKAGVLTAPELKKVVPSAFFFRGQTASVQLRNAVGFRNSSDRYVLAALVDTSGYSTDIQEKYQGLLITEVKLKVGDAFLAPGAYGFGFKDNKFMVLDISSTEILNVPFKTDDALAHPVPLKLTADGASYRLYAGKKWVSLGE
jgi:hypothetical protein